MKLGTLLKTVDDNGSKHDANGQFSSASESAKPKEQKPRKPRGSAPFLGHVWATFDTGQSPKTGAGVNFLSANHEWGGYGGGREGEAMYGKTPRWDTQLADLGPDSYHTVLMRSVNTPNDAPEKATRLQAWEAARGAMKANRLFLLSVRARTDQTIANIEHGDHDFNKRNPQQRAKVREQYAAAYYDHNRIFPCIAGSEPSQFREMQRLLRTRELAGFVAANKPKSLKKLIEAVDKADKAGNLDATKLHTGDIEREYLMYKHAVHVSDSLEADQLTDSQTLMYFTQKFIPKAATPDFMRDLAVSLDYGLGALARTKDVATIQHGVSRPDSATLGACAHNKTMVVTGSLPESGDDFATTVNHEMLHGLSKYGMAKEMAAFNEWLGEKVGKPPAEPLPYTVMDAARNEVNYQKHVSQFITGHGLRSRNHNNGDFQEDWAIGLSEFVIGLGGKAARRTAMDSRGELRDVYEAVPKEAPRRETVEFLAKLFGRDVPEGALDGLHSFPSPENASGNEYEIGRQRLRDNFAARQRVLG